MQAADKSIDNIEEYIRTKADEKLLNRMIVAERSGNEKRYRELQLELMKDYAEHQRE